MKITKDKESIVRCSIVGDSFVGKTALIRQFLEEETTGDLTSTIFDNFAGNVHTTDGDYTISIFDTTGNHDLDGLRHFPYAQSDVVIVCYSIVDRTSFINVLKVWIPEIKKNTKKNTFIVLVATHCDLNDAKFAVVSRNEGISMANKICAFCYVETSAYDFENISKLFNSIVMKIAKKRRNIISKLFRR